MKTYTKTTYKLAALILFCMTQSLHPQGPYNAQAEIFLSTKMHHLQTIADLDLKFLEKLLPEAVLSNISATGRYLQGYVNDVIDAYEQKYPENRRLKNYELDALKNSSEIKRAIQDRAWDLWDYHHKKKLGLVAPEVKDGEVYDKHTM